MGRTRRLARPTAIPKTPPLLDKSLAWDVYWAHRLAAPSKRALWDTTITEILAGYYEPGADGKRPPESLYGSLKMWAHLQRQGIPVARRTVERIMRANGWRGATRARRAPRTTERDPAAARAPDLVGRRWRVTAPNLLVVADFTYVPMAAGSATPRSSSTPTPG